METLENAYLEGVAINGYASEYVRSMHVPSDPRDRMALKAADYGFELHDSILCLMRQEKYAAAAAMHRLLLESCISSLWLLHVASIQHVQELEAGKGDLPSSTSMLTKCRAIPGMGDALTQLGSIPKMFHQLTHGDPIQINRRRLDAPMNGVYPLLEKYSQALLANTLLLALMEIASVAMRDDAFQAHARSERSKIMGALHLIFKVPLQTPTRPLSWPTRD